MNDQRPENQSATADMLTHAELVDQGRRAASALTRLGVGAGSRLAVLLPMCLESVVITLACIRLDAVRISLPLGDHTGWVRHRIRSSGAQVVITADSCLHEGAMLPVKAGLDQILAGCPEVHSVLVVPQQSRPVSWTPGRDRWWGDVLAAQELPARPYSGAMTSTPSDRPERPLPSFVFDDPLAARSADDRDEGWGERPSGAAAGDLARFIDEKPPHHA
jgi:acetyl-CoA synthetase